MITKEQQKYLRSLAHDRKPVVWVGQNGLTENVLEEIKSALNHHELIKIKLRTGDRDSRDGTIKIICAETEADLVQSIGNILTLYRKNKKDPVIKLPV